MTTKEVLKTAFQKSSENFAQVSSSESFQQTVLSALNLILDTYKKGGGLFACGNGGSAADAQHFVAELVVKLRMNRTPIKAFAMSVDTSILTAAGNDFGYDTIFSRQVEANMSKNDVLFAITTSGNSPNVLEAMKMAKQIGCKIVLLSGGNGGKARELADVAILAPGENTNQIQEVHLLTYHSLCYLIELGLVEAGMVHYK